MFSKQPSLPVDQVIGISSNAKKDQSYIIHAEGQRLTWSMPITAGSREMQKKAFPDRNRERSLVSLGHIRG